MDYDVVVVGAGMIGSAAAKYIISQDKNLRVCLVGPSEPKRKKDVTIHGAHYDEARICSMSSKDVIWGELSRRSLLRFRDIEKQTGLPIYHEVGLLCVGTKGLDMVTKFKASSESMGQEYNFLERSSMIKSSFPYMDFGPDVQAVYTQKHSGYINPRKLLEAQKMIAQKHGCLIIDDIVESVQPMSDGYIIRRDNGQLMTSKKVLLCTGGFTHCRRLLPDSLVPCVDHHPNTVILVEVNEEEQCRLRGMPSVAYKGGQWDHPGLNQVAYILPPVRYPDGKYYLKVGHGHIEPHLLHTPQEIAEWHWGGAQPEVKDFLYQVTRTLFPGLKMDRYKYDYCVTTSTPKDYPFLDLIRPTLGVAIGGCGQAASSSDEIGKMAARMITKGSWDHDLPESAFKFQAARPTKSSKL